MGKTEGKILVVDDDAYVLATAKMLLKQEITVVQTEINPEQLPKLMAREAFDLILLDMNFTKGESDGKEGLMWLNSILEIDPKAIVILITAYGEVDLAVNAIKAGATDFVVKPWNNEKMLATVHAALQLRKSHVEVEKLRTTQQRLNQQSNKAFGEIIGESPAIKRVYELIEKVADTDANVLILGENGTGKELVARALHQKSSRGQQAFIGVDLGALSESLFESELFGHVKGAFTDAKEDRVGCFELASGGTLFLDEIGNLSPTLQTKLLAVLQNREIRRVGGNRQIKVDIRLVSATNMPLYDMVKGTKEDAHFRQDLLYRINTVEIRLPSLRERISDIPLLTEHFLNIYTQKYKKTGLRLEAGAMNKLSKYHWPGNIRELQHAVERAVILSGSNTIKATDLLLNTNPSPQKINSEVSSMTLEEMEQTFIREALERNQGNVTKTASELGLTRTALYRRLNKHGL